MGVEDIGVITSVGEQNSILERRKEMIEHGFVSEKLNVGVIKEKLDEIREFGRRLWQMEHVIRFRFFEMNDRT